MTTQTKHSSELLIASANGRQFMLSAIKDYWDTLTLEAISDNLSEKFCVNILSHALSITLTEQDTTEIIKIAISICCSCARDIITNVIVLCLQIMKLYISDVLQAVEKLLH